jgi:hypothetical protein
MLEFISGLGDTTGSLGRDKSYIGRDLKHGSGQEYEGVQK